MSDNRRIEEDILHKLIEVTNNCISKLDEDDPEYKVGKELLDKLLEALEQFYNDNHE